MAKDQGKVSEAKGKTVAELPLACSDETAATEFLERQRWGGSPECPFCGGTEVYQMRDRDGNRQRNYRWRCKGCGKQYTVRVGTIMEASPIPLRWWCWAFWMACSSENGVSALQISRETGLSYKSALFMMHRIRHAMAHPYAKEPPSGAVEADETYVGGKVKNRYPKYGAGSRKDLPRKAPVLALIERGREARAMVLPRVTAATLGAAIRRHVAKEATLATDEHRVYIPVGRQQAGGHLSVCHSRNEYARGEAHINTAESFFAILKRGLYGTFHAVSEKHLHRYVSEFEFRWNSRKMDDGERISKAIQGAEGKRLRYKEPSKAN